LSEIIRRLKPDGAPLLRFSEQGSPNSRFTSRGDALRCDAMRAKTHLSPDGPSADLVVEGLVSTSGQGNAIAVFNSPIMEGILVCHYLDTVTLATDTCTNDNLQTSTENAQILILAGNGFE